MPMPSRTPLPLNKPIGVNLETNPVDVVITKRSLSRLGHYKVPKWGLSSEPDTYLFVGIRRFQRQRKLKVDGLMKPEGPTASEIGRILTQNTPHVPSTKINSKSGAPTPEECDHLYFKVDIPTCRAISARRGKRSAAHCFHSAGTRYGLCLSGRPINELPPLNTWNN